jgi:hypothetical protein
MEEPKHEGGYGNLRFVGDSVFERCRFSCGHSAAPTFCALQNDTGLQRQQEHPFGSAFETVGYCQVRLVVYAGPGANATLNVMGSSDPNVMTGSGAGWVPEREPLSFTGAKNWNGIFLGAVLRHRFVEFFLSTPDKPGVPDINASIGGAVIVQASGITPGVERARWLLHSRGLGWESPEYCPSPEPWKG